MKGVSHRFKAPELAEILKYGLMESTPIDVLFKPRTSHLGSRISSLIYDLSAIAMINYFIIGLSIVAVSDYMGPFATSFQQKSAIQFSGIILLPLLYFMTMAYFYLNYQYNDSSTVSMRWQELRVIPLSYMSDSSEQVFRINDEQILKRSLAHFINIALLHLPNLISLVDPYHRSFTDIFSGTLAVTQNDFIELFQSKGASEYQIFIDIQSLSTIETDLKTQRAA